MGREAVAADEAVEAFARDRDGEGVALELVAADLAEEGALGVGLDAFGGVTRDLYQFFRGLRFGYFPENE